MTTIATLDQVSLAFGLDLLLDHVKFKIDAKERVCLIGRNGAGKSSLLKLIEGTLLPDSGTVQRKPHLRIARLAQELPPTMSNTVFSYVAEGLADIGNLLATYHDLTLRLSSPEDLLRLERLQQSIDVKNGWAFEQKIKTVLSRLSLSADAKISELSGGWQRRAALAKALVTSPELLLLDEPTNHLDIETIQWLEDQLLEASTTLLFITHDRALLQRLATRIIELDRGKLTSWPGDYANFLRRKEEMLHAESKQHADFDKKLAQEEKWIRQGIKARRTRNEGRVRALEAMREERKRRREVQETVSFAIESAEKSGNIVIDANDITQQYHGNTIINHFSIRIRRGDRIGLIGPNGIGKSTLLNILLGNIPPQFGMVTLGTKLNVAYFDQHRAALDLEKTVIENVVQGSDTIEINGSKRHIISYLSDFLFTPQRALTPVKALSGGECNRLLLARLFSQSTNLLVLDEPTNDLDIETLELLEELLCQYQGTLLIVSHDRAFINNIVTSTLVFEGNGHIQEYAGGYDDWLKQRASPQIKEAAPSKSPLPKVITPKSSAKLTYKEQKELAELPKQIEAMELEQSHLQQLIANDSFYEESHDIISKTMHQLTQLTTQLEAAYERWNELDKRSDSQKSPPDKLD